MRQKIQYASMPARLLAGAGRMFMRSYFGHITGIVLSSLNALFSDIRQRRLQTGQIISQAYFTGVEAFPLISLVAILLGSLTILQALTVMPKVGFGDFFGNLMVLVIIRELGPILTAFLIAGRTGSALAAYLSYSKVGSEVDALETMGIDPIRFLVMPSMAGGMLAVLFMTALFNGLAVFVGFLIVKILTIMLGEMFPVDLQWDIFYTSILSALSWADIVMAFVKPLVFGAIIAANASYYGLHISRDIREVPQSTSKSVVRSFIMIVITDMLLSLVYIFEYLSTLSTVI